MISDTLHEAVKDIDDYLTRFPETYQDYRSEVLDVIEAMERLRQKLDTPPVASLPQVGQLVRAAEDVVNLYEHPDSGHMGKAVRHLGEVLEPWLNKPCANCGTSYYHQNLDENGLCDRCSELAERSTSRSLHGSAGLGWEPR